MNLTENEKQILKELCEQHKINFEKAVMLIEKEKEFELKGRRTGVYDALKDILKTDINSN